MRLGRRNPWTEFACAGPSNACFQSARYNPQMLGNKIDENVKQIFTYETYSKPI